MVLHGSCIGKTVFWLLAVVSVRNVLFLPVLFTATNCILLKLCVCVCMYVCMYVYVFMCMYVFVCVCVLCMYVCLYVCVCIYVYVCICMCVCVCVYVYICIYIYIYIYMAKVIWYRGVIVTHTKCCILISFQMSSELFAPLSLGIQQYFLYISRFRGWSCVHNGTACLSSVPHYSHQPNLFRATPSDRTFLRPFVPLCFSVKYYKSAVCPSSTSCTCIKI